MTIVALLALTAILTPIYISFISDKNTIFYYINLVFDISFGADILLNFLTAYYDENKKLVTGFSRIWTRYLQFWFWIDLIAMYSASNSSSSKYCNRLPLENMMTISTQQSMSIVRINRLLRLLRIPRLYRMLKILDVHRVISLFSWSHQFSKMIKRISLNVTISRIMKLLINLTFLNHVGGCLWFFMVSKRKFNGNNLFILQARLHNFSPDTWVGKAELIDKGFFAQYVASIYWTFTTLTAVGYGDIVPETQTEKLFSFVWMVIGVTVYSFVISNLSTFLANFGMRSDDLRV